MNRMLTTLTYLASLPLCAENVGDLQFQFPASQHEWKSLINNVIVENALRAIDDEVEGLEKVCFKLFTHREGDALEMFTATTIANQDLVQDAAPLSDAFLTEEGDSTIPEEATVEYMQRTIDQFFLQLPNHKVTILDIEKTADNLFYSWELNDGSIDVIHGYSRIFKTEAGQAALNYVTTAPHTESNKALWIQVLSSASIKTDAVVPVEEAPIVENSIEEILPVVTEEVAIAVETVLTEEEVVVVEETIAIVEEVIEELTLEEPVVNDAVEEISSLPAVVEVVLASNE